MSNAVARGKRANKQYLNYLLRRLPNIYHAYLFRPLMIALVVSVGIVSGCAFNPAPVSTRMQPPDQRITYHLVAAGDTLFSIAWQYEKDMDALARANNLAPPYRINVGQQLTLDTSRPPLTKSRSSQKIAVVKKPTTKPELLPSRQPNIKINRPSNKTRTTTKSNNASATAYSTAYKWPGGKLNWRWPIKGAVSRHYDASKVFKGINIQSLPGRTVGAAADGVVVYAGSGLRGYGNLIIIKHSEIYLSAYAHNRTLSVREGDRVKAGVPISTVGGDANNRGRLYFELRKSGKPVDPMRLLPRE